MGPFYGGPLVNKAVNAVFAALIWHSQDIREELTPESMEIAWRAMGAPMYTMLMLAAFATPCTYVKQPPDLKPPCPLCRVL